MNKKQSDIIAKPRWLKLQTFQTLEVIISNKSTKARNSHLVEILAKKVMPR